MKITAKTSEASSSVKGKELKDLNPGVYVSKDHPECVMVKITPEISCCVTEYNSYFSDTKNFWSKNYVPSNQKVVLEFSNE